MPLPLHPTAAAKPQAELAGHWTNVADHLPDNGKMVEARTPAPDGGWYVGRVRREGQRWVIVLTGDEMLRGPTHWREVR